jgi:hypothetical protein
MSDMKAQSLTVGFFWLLFLVQAALGGPSDLLITCVKKKIETLEANQKALSAYSVSKTEQWGYVVSVENQGFKQLENMDVKYYVFSKHEHLGYKGAPKTDTMAGSYKIDLLGTLAKKSFETDGVTLNSAALVGNYYYGNGAKGVVHDSLLGIWIRIYDGQKVVAEYTYPANLAGTEKWPGN